MDTKHRVKNFWKYFMGVRHELEAALRGEDEDLLQDLRREVNMQAASVCDAQVELETHDGFFEITFHGGANKTKQYICALLKKDAPQELVDDWIINAFRQPLSQSAYNTLLAIDDHSYSGADFIIYYEVDRSAKCIAIEVYSEALSKVEEERHLSIVIAMLELYIGEIELEARIGDIRILDEPRQDAQNFCYLPNFYEDICDIVIDEDWSEYSEPCAIYSAYKLDREITSDSLRKDMKLIITTNALLQEELLNHEADSCEEAQRFGSQYAYLYYEIDQKGEASALVRQQLERELQELLYPMSVARTIGGAIGIHYAYIDLIVFDTDALQIVLERLNEHLSFPLYYQAFTF